MVVVTPGVAGAGVEQDAHRCQVDGDARAFESVCIAPRRELAPAIDAAGGKMPPTAVEGDIQIGIGLAGDFGDVGSQGRHLLGMIRKVVEAVGTR